MTAAVCLLVSAASCVNIVRPNFESQLANLRSGNYELDPAHAVVLFKVEHLGLSLYVGRFNTMTAELSFDPADIEATQLSGTVELASVDTNNADIEDLLRGGDWFNTGQHPNATFATTAVTLAADDSLLVEGLLTLRGQTHPILLQARFNGGADNLLTRRYTLGFTATGELSRTDFGMDAFAGLIANEVELEIHAEFLRK